MATGLVTPNEGRVFLNDVDITKLPVYKRAQLGIGYLPQEASVFRTLSVENNIRTILEMTDTTPEYQRDRLEQLIGEFHLQKVRKSLGNRLSGGERRRCEIARCLAINPRFIMLDEPFAGVDPIAVEDIQSIVYSLKSKNIGILITTHPRRCQSPTAPTCFLRGKSCFRAPARNWPTILWCATNTWDTTLCSGAKTSTTCYEIQRHSG